MVNVQAINLSGPRDAQAAMKEQAVLSCRDLGKSYEEGPESVVVLSGLQLELHPGERLMLSGRSGSGKSTLLRAMGSVWLDGEELSALSEKKRGLLRNRSLGFVYQFHHLLPEFTALENVCMPLLSGFGVSSVRSAAGVPGRWLYTKE